MLKPLFYRLYQFIYLLFIFKCGDEVSVRSSFRYLEMMFVLLSPSPMHGPIQNTNVRASPSFSSKSAPAAHDVVVADSLGHHCNANDMREAIHCKFKLASGRVVGSCLHHKWRSLPNYLLLVAGEFATTTNHRGPTWHGAI